MQGFGMLLKRWRVLIAVGVSIAAVVAVIVFVFGGQAASACPRQVANKAVEVETIMKAPQCYRTEVRVEGVVSKVMPQKKTLTLVDLREKDDCDNDSCPVLRLPVQWSGVMPVRKARVLALGKIAHLKGKLIFNAKAIDTIREGLRR